MKSIFRLLQAFCPPQLFEEIEGDLIQKFEKDVKLLGVRKAKRRLLWSVIRFLRLGILLRNKFSIELNAIYMIKSHFKIAYRHLTRSKVITSINVLGLTVGIAAFLLITSYINFELSFDQFHTNKNNIYRIGLKRYEHGELIEGSAKTFPGIRSLLHQHFPEVKSLTGFYKTPANTGFLFRHQGKIYNEPGGWLNPDSSFFSVFSSLLVRGNAATALKNPNSLVISESLAKKLFGDQDPVGLTLERIDDHNNEGGYTITGILRDIPENSHFHATVIEPIYDSWPESDTEYWGEGRLSTYIRLSENTSPDNVENKLNALLVKLGKENPQVKNTKVVLQRMTDIHLYSNLKDELESNGSMSLLILLGVVGIIIIAIAWINYVNLETSRFVTHLKEFGVRRIVGSRKVDLALQFLTEYFCLTLAAVLLAVLLLIYIAPHFTPLTGVPLKSIATLKSTTSIIALITFLMGSIIVGIYPALFLMKFNPVLALKGKIGHHISKTPIRHALVVFQFTTSLILIGFVLAVDEQVNFMGKTNKGVELEKVIALRNATAYSNQETSEKHGEFTLFENKLLQNPAIRSVASSSAIPGTEIGFSYIDLIKRNMGDPYDPTVYKTMFVSAHFIPTYGLEFLAGENFSTPKNYSGNAPWESDNWSTIILNERAIHQLGFRSPEEALNKEVYFQPFNDYLKCRIIGVIKDYYHEAVKKEIYPTILFNNYASFQQVYFSVRLNRNTNPQEALANIEKSWKDIFSDRPFEYFFLDDYYDQQFKSELRFQNIFSTFAIIAVFIACLGIFGMALYESNSRLKEISIRKVLGASMTNLLLLLSKNNLRIVTVSVLIASPFIYLIINQWLLKYPLRIGFSLSFILIPLVTVLLLIIVISGFQTIKAALSNPIDQLKNE